MPTNCTESYRDEYNRLWNLAVDILTTAARLDHPEYGPVDFADFLVSTIRATAANLGDIHELTAGRPGSWESAMLADMAQGAAGQDPADLTQYRTEPIAVTLNIAQLVEGNHDDRKGTIAPFDMAVDDLPSTNTQTDWDHRQAQLRQRYEALFTEYGQAFTAAINNIARDHNIQAPRKGHRGCRPGIEMVKRRRDHQSQRFRLRRTRLEAVDRGLRRRRIPSLTTHIARE